MKGPAITLLLLLLVLPALLAGPALAQDADDEKDFRKRVDHAISKGCEYLAQIQSADGTWPSGYDDKYPGGSTALCLLALLTSEYNVWSDACQNALKYVREHDFDRTYTAAVAMMAIEARHIPPDEFKAMREGKEIRKFVRKLKRDDKQWMKRHVDMLLNGRQYEAWGYPKGPDFASDWFGDMSNTQYAVLGLKSAARCGVKVDDDEWMKILRLVLKAQDREGEKVKLVVERSADEDGYSTSSARIAETRGWKYIWPVVIKSGGKGGKTHTQTRKVPDDEKTSGSMTTAGISCLAIIHSELRRSRRYQSMKKDVGQALDDGFAWLQENWAVEENPGGKREWHYYYLYGLERAGVLADRRWIGEHDWYREGAEFLLDRQGGGGSWPGGVIDTCFALLFLKRSTTPVTLTGLPR